MYYAVAFDEAARKRIAQAAELEKRMRLESFLDLPTDLGFCKVRSITPRDCVIFDIDDNKLFGSGPIMMEDCLHLAWTLRIEKCKEYKFAKKVGKAWLADIMAIDRCREFVGGTFIDCPKFGGKDCNESNSGVWLPSLIDCIASEYGWRQSEIMNTPIKNLFLLMQQIYRRNFGKKYMLSNPITQTAKSNELKNLERSVSNG
jgi:hypothetical protein